MNNYSEKIFIVLIAFIIFMSCEICTNEIIKSDRLDDNNKIVLFSRDAGATTSSSLQISIIDKNEQLENKKGNLCITDGKYLDYKIESNSIIIYYTGELFLRKESFGTYKIEYIHK